MNLFTWIPVADALKLGFLSFFLLKCDVLTYALLASRLQTASLQTRLLRHFDIVTFGPTFDNALNVFNVKIETDLLSNPSEIAAPKLMKKLADIYFTRVTQTAESSFSLSTRHMALWKSQMEDHTSDWLRVVPISGLGQCNTPKMGRNGIWVWERYFIVPLHKI
ncbi:hypothetical protein Tco_0053482 [Tanacetum coccineum]